MEDKPPRRRRSPEVPVDPAPAPTRAPRRRAATADAAGATPAARSRRKSGDKAAPAAPSRKTPAAAPAPLPDNVVVVSFGQAAQPAASAPLAAPPGPAVVPLDAVSSHKLETFRALIDEALVAVMVDPRIAGVEIPAALRGQPWVVLNFSHRFRLPDFAYDEAGVRATLSFPQGDAHVSLPWRSVFLLAQPSTRREVPWPEHFPPALVEQIRVRQAQARADAEKARTRGPGPFEAPSAEGNTGGEAPHLRVVRDDDPES